MERTHTPTKVLEILPQAVAPAQAVADAPLDAAQVLLLARQVMGTAQAEELTAVLQEP